MATLKIVQNKYDNDDAVENVIFYVYDIKKTRGDLIGGYGVYLVNSIQDVILQFQKVKDVYQKNSGNRIRHFIVSFSKIEDFSLKEIYNIAMEFAAYYGKRYQVFFGIHGNTDHRHIHFVMNTVSYIDGKKYAEGYDDFLSLESMLIQLLRVIIKNFIR